MADTPDIQFKLGMNLDDLFAGLGKATQGIEKATKDMSSSFGGLGKGIEALKGPFLAISAALAGGAIFKDMINSAKEMGGEVRRLSGYFQISNKDAGLMAESLKRMGSSADEFIGNADKIAKQVKKNEDRFNQLGISTRGANGNYLTQIEILNGVAKKLNETEGSLAKNILAQELAGRGGKELALYYEKYAGAVKATEENLKRLGIAIDYDQLVAGTKKYKSAMADIDQQLEVMKISIAVDLMPALTDMADMLGDILPPILKTISVLFKGIVIAVDTIVFVIKVLGSMVGGVFGAMVDSIEPVIDMFIKLANFDFKGAWEASKKAAQAIVTNFKAAGEQIAEDFNKLGDKIGKIVDGTGDRKEAPEAKDGGKPAPEKDTDKLLGKLQKELEIKRLAKAAELGVDKDFYELSKADTMAFWSEKLTHYKAGSKDYNEIAKQVDSSRKAMRTEELTKEKADLDKALEQNRFNFDAKINLAEAFLAKQKTRFAADSTQVKEAEKNLEKIRQDALAANTKILETRANITREQNLALIDDQEIAAKNQASHFQISALDLLKLELKFENERFDIKKAAIVERIRLIELEGDLVKAEEEKQKLAQLEREHNKASKGISSGISNEQNNISGNGGFAEGINQYLEQSKNKLADYKNMALGVAQSLQGAFAASITSIFNGQFKLANSLSALYKGLKDVVLQSITQMMAKQAVAWAFEKGKQAWDATALKLKQAQDTEKQASDTPTIYSGLMGAFASIPFGLGIPLALLAIAGVMALIKSVTARAVGGLVDSPQLSLVGEAGPEVIAPLSDFKDFAKSFVSMGASMYGSIAEKEASKNGYTSYSSNLASGVKGASSGSNSSNSISITHNWSGANLIGTDKANMDTVSKFIHQDLKNNYDDIHN